MFHKARMLNRFDKKKQFCVISVICLFDMKKKNEIKLEHLSVATP